MTVPPPTPARIRTRRRYSAALVIFVCAILLIAEGSLLESRIGGSPLTVVVEKTESASGAFSVEFQLTPKYGAIEVHVALVPGSSRSATNHVYVFYDPGFSTRFGSPNDVVGLEERLSAYFAELPNGIPVSFVDSAQLPTVLLANPEAVFIDFAYSELPDTVFSKNTSLLKTWIEGGGTLIWAGGPLAYFEGSAATGGSSSQENLGWRGQVDLTGFPLEDPLGNPAQRSYGPLLGQNETAVAASLGMQYSGTPDGANLTEVVAHNGTDLGFDSAGVGRASERTSLAYIPIGLGRLFFFGGGIWGDGVGAVPNADTFLSSDIALLVAAGYTPSAGPTTGQDVALVYLQSSYLTLSVSGTYMHLVAIITSTVGPAYLFIWSRQLI